MKKSRYIAGVLLLGLAVFLAVVRITTESETQGAQAAEPALVLIPFTETPTVLLTATPIPSTLLPTSTLIPTVTVIPPATKTLTPQPVVAPGVSEGLTLLREQLSSDTALKAAVCAPDWDIEPREGEVIVPILLYHFVGRDTLEEDGHSTTRYNVTLADFRTQLALFEQLGYHTVTVSEIAAALRGERTLAERSIAITVDDGWTEQYSHIFTTLQNFDMRATFYIPSTYPVGGRFVTWEQVAEMIDAGMEIGSHTRNHVDLTELDTEALRTQVLSSKLVLENKLGITVESISYPFGNYNSVVTAAVREAGYSAGVALGPALRQSKTRIFALTRIEVFGTRPLLDLVNRLPWRGQETNLCLQPVQSDPYN